MIHPKRVRLTGVDARTSLYVRGGPRSRREKKNNKSVARRVHVVDARARGFVFGLSVYGNLEFFTETSRNGTTEVASCTEVARVCNAFPGSDVLNGFSFVE